MAVRRTKRGSERTPFSGETYDLIVCGASFAGLAVLRELGVSAVEGRRILLLDRYEIGERPTSACAAPTAWLRNLGLADSVQQTFDSIVVHTPEITRRWAVPWTFSTFDYRRLCELMYARAPDATEFETAKVDGRTGEVIHTDRGDVTAPLIVDALGWRRVLSAGKNFQPPDAPLSRGLEVHPRAARRDLELWIDRSYVPAGYGWSFPAGEECRVGVGSFDPGYHVKDPTVRLANALDVPTDNYQGNWIPHQLRDATEDGIFFAGDSAGHCLPLTAEGIRTALYFGIACGREIHSVIAGNQTKTQALQNYHEFSASHSLKYKALLRAQKTLPRMPLRAVNKTVRAFTRSAVTNWTFEHYLRIAPPSFALTKQLPRPHL